MIASPLPAAATAPTQAAIDWAAAEMDGRAAMCDRNPEFARLAEHYRHAAALLRRVRPHVAHNHGPEEGPGLACRETHLNDGRVIGACLLAGGSPREVRDA